MSEEMQGMAVRLYSLLTSYTRQRPLKLVCHVKQENGVVAWQVLLKEMQPATPVRSLALLSRVQFAEGKTLSEQLPQYEAIVAEYERISGREYSEDAKVDSILQACPNYMKQHLQLWVDDSTTYESLKNKIHHLEALTTRWEASNSLALPTRASGDDPMPMEVDYVGKEKGKKGGKKGKDAKGKSKSKDKGKGKPEGKGSWKGQEKGKTMWEKGPWRKPEKGKSEKGGKGAARAVYATFVASQVIMPKNVGRESNRLRNIQIQVEQRVHQQDKPVVELHHRPHQ